MNDKRPTTKTVHLKKTKRGRIPEWLATSPDLPELQITSSRRHSALMAARKELRAKLGLGQRVTIQAREVFK